MNALQRQALLDELKGLRLPELQARFHEHTGEETRCPNKTYLLRRIGEALEALEVSPEPEGSLEPPTRLRDLSVDQLRVRYVEVIGRETQSHDRRYLMWKLRQAEQGRMPTGPAAHRGASSTPVEHKVLPLRMPVATVEALDEVWQRQGLKSRMELFRVALGHYLASCDEGEVARLVRG